MDRFSQETLSTNTKPKEPYNSGDGGNIEILQCASHARKTSQVSMHHDNGQFSSSGVFQTPRISCNSVETETESRRGRIQNTARGGQDTSRIFSILDASNNTQSTTSSKQEPMQTMYCNVHRARRFSVLPSTQPKPNGNSCGGMWGVGGCKQLSHDVIALLNSVGANHNGFGPCVPTDYEFETNYSFSKWAYLLTEDSLCPVCNLEDGTLMVGSSGTFYFEVIETVFALGTDVNVMSLYFTGVLSLDNIAPVQLPELEEVCDWEKLERLQDEHDQLQQQEANTKKLYWKLNSNTIPPHISLLSTPHRYRRVHVLPYLSKWRFSNKYPTLSPSIESPLSITQHASCLTTATAPHLSNTQRKSRQTIVNQKRNQLQVHNKENIVLQGH